MLAVAVATVTRKFFDNGSHTEGGAGDLSLNYQEAPADALLTSAFLETGSDLCSNDTFRYCLNNAAEYGCILQDNGTVYACQPTRDSIVYNCTFEFNETMYGCAMADNFDAEAGFSKDTLSAGAVSLVYFLYALTVFLTVVGNIVVIVVFARGRRCRTDIRGFLVNLAISDLVIGIVCLPFSSVVPQLGWIFPDALCPLVMFAQHLSVVASVYINTAIGIDRFLAVRYPFKRLTASRSRVTAIVAVIWVAAAGLASVQLAVGRVEEDSGRRACREVWPEPEFEQHYSVVILFSTYVAPVSLVGIMYTLVCRHLWSSSHPGAADVLRDNKQLRAKRKVVKMLMVIVALFTFCWLPLHLFFVVLQFFPEELSTLMSGAQIMVCYYCVHLLAMSNSFQNPIIYGFLNDNFRSDLAELLISYCPICSQLPLLQKAAARQQSSLSRHVSFRRQHSDRWHEYPRHVSIGGPPPQDSGSASEQRMPPVRRQAHLMQDLETKDISKNGIRSLVSQTGDDPVRTILLSESVKYDYNDNTTLPLLDHNLPNYRMSGTHKVRGPTLTVLFDDNGGMVTDYSRTEEVTETMAFVSP